MQSVLFTKNPDSYPHTSLNCHIVTEFEQLNEYVTKSRPDFILIDRYCPYAMLPEYPDYFPTVIFATEPMLLKFLSQKYDSHNMDTPRHIPTQMNKVLDTALLRFFFSPSLKGYRYIKQALYYQYVNSHEISAVKKDIYESVSNCYKTSVYSVERGITFAIRKAYSENPLLFRTLFPNGKKSPSNMAFLKTFFIYLEQEGYL